MPSSVEETLVGSEDRHLPGPDDLHRLERGALVGRYFILSRLGAGAMGVVYSAYDPELDRKVALKLLHSPDPEKIIDDERRALLLREAQALAQLSHPNVVAVYDVGTLHDQVWLAMEFVKGQTLRQWAKQSRTWSEVLELMEQAAKGLCAAHDADLLHRDFKPDNVMVSDDGRVRVMDFGLAYKPPREDSSSRETTEGLDLDLQSDIAAMAMHSTPGGTLRGSPAYMSPEQMARTKLDPRSDQFAYCVTLWELLYGKRPFAGGTVMALIGSILKGQLVTPPRGSRVPTWLRRVVERGLGREREQRFDDMHALLDAIAQGRTRARRRWIAGGVTAVVAVVAGALGFEQHAALQRQRTCEATGDIAHAQWNDTQRAIVRDRLVATGVSFAESTADRVMPWIDQQANSWADASVLACRHATIDRDWEPDRQARAQWCLQGRREQLEALIGALLEVDRHTVASAVQGAAELEPVELCVDPAQLHRLPPPPPAEAREKVAALRHDLALSVAKLETIDGTEDRQAALRDIQRLRERAEHSGWGPIHAAALLQEARVFSAMGRYEEAERVSTTAFTEAGRAGAWTLAARAAETLISNVGYRQARYDGGKIWAEMAEMAAALGGDPTGQREITRLLHLAMAQDMAGLEHKHLNERALQLGLKSLGPTHPQMGDVHKRLGNSELRRGRYEEAVEHYGKSLEILEEAMGAEHPVTAALYNNLCIAHRYLGDYPKAQGYCEKTLKIWEDTYEQGHPTLAVACTNLGDIHRLQEQLPQALALHRRAGKIRAKALGVDHPYYAQSRSKEGEVLLRQGDAASALGLLEEAYGIYEGIEGVQDNELSARFWLAEALAATGGDEARALRLARGALEALGPFRGSELTTTEQIEKWLAARPKPPAG